MADDECGEAASSGEAVQITDGAEDASGSRMAAIFSAVAGEAARFRYSLASMMVRMRAVTAGSAGSGEWTRTERS